MRIIFFILFQAICLFAYRWCYEHGTGMRVGLECELYKSRWDGHLSTAKEKLSQAPENVREYLLALLVEKEYSVENCLPIAQMKAEQVLSRAQVAYQNDSGNFQSFEHYRADLIERMDAINFFDLHGTLLEGDDYWELSFRQAFFLGTGPYKFHSDFTRRFALSQSVVVFTFLIFLFFFPGSSKRRYLGL